MTGDRRALGPLILLGCAAGVLSGLFGVGGGIILVPTLILQGFDQRIAAGTSAAAVLPTAVVGAVGYGVTGRIDWIAGAALAVGVVVGAQVGSWLLARLPRRVLFWSFFVFLVLTAVSLWFSVPQRDDTIGISVGAVVGLVLLGVVTGVLAGVLGVGGGVLVVPALMFFFGAGDLVAKGTSLLMMVPGSISATRGNMRRGNIDVRAAVALGVTACAASPLGLWAATLISPLASNVAFSVLVCLVAIQLALTQSRAR